jgi:hypothetical protein
MGLNRKMAGDSTADFNSALKYKIETLKSKKSEGFSKSTLFQATFG